MLDIRDFEVKKISSEKVDELENKGWFDPMELNAIEPFPTEEELYALGNSLIHTNFSNKTDPIVLYRGKIADGKSRFRALRTIKAKVFYFVVIPTKTKKEEVNTFIMKTQIRRDKTKTQKAISAYKFYKIHPTYTLHNVAKQYGVSERSVNSVKFIDIAGLSDVIELLHTGGKYEYEATNNRTGVIEKKFTTSISIVEKLLKGKQKDTDLNDSLFDDSLFDDICLSNTDEPNDLKTILSNILKLNDKQLKILSKDLDNLLQSI